MANSKAFYDTINAAIRDIEIHGFDSMARIDNWTQKILAAARRAMVPQAELEKALQKTFTGIYTRMLKGGFTRIAPGMSRFKADQLKPKLRRELDRRIMNSANLIKLNREAMIEKTRQRFVGWATSVPEGGSKAVDRKDVRGDLRKAMGQLPFEERRVMIDQGHKFTATLADVIATDNGAIAARWHSHWCQPGYDYREDHKERDDHVYLIRDSWAHDKGFVKPNKSGYTDQITQPGEEVFCQCEYEYIYNIRDLPEDMITAKGRESLSAARDKINRGG